MKNLHYLLTGGEHLEEADSNRNFTAEDLDNLLRPMTQENQITENILNEKDKQIEKLSIQHEKDLTDIDRLFEPFQKRHREYLAEQQINIKNRDMINSEVSERKIEILFKKHLKCFEDIW